MRIKVCGMKFEENIRELKLLEPDYMGFLFYPGSKRFVGEEFQGLDEEFRKASEDFSQVGKEPEKIGVFVNQEVSDVVENTRSSGLRGIQLHGDESPAYIVRLSDRLKDSQVEIIKAFPVGDTMNWEELRPYEEICDYFLFDTKGKDRGGNGIQFDWEILSGYQGKTKYFLSGGIGPDNLEALKEFSGTPKAELCHAVDVNSRFEIYPGMKDIDKLRTFIQEFKAIRS